MSLAPIAEFAELDCWGDSAAAVALQQLALASDSSWYEAMGGVSLGGSRVLDVDTVGESTDTSMAIHPLIAALLAHARTEFVDGEIWRSRWMLAPLGDVTLACSWVLSLVDAWLAQPGLASGAQDWRRLEDAVRIVELHQASLRRIEARLLAGLQARGCSPQQASVCVAQWLVWGDPVLIAGPGAVRSGADSAWTRWLGRGLDGVLINAPAGRVGAIDRALRHEYRLRTRLELDQHWSWAYLSSLLDRVRLGGQAIVIRPTMRPSSNAQGQVERDLGHRFHVQTLMELPGTLLAAAPAATPYGPHTVPATLWILKRWPGSGTRLVRARNLLDGVVCAACDDLLSLWSSAASTAQDLALDVDLSHFEAWPLEPGLLPRRERPRTRTQPLTDQTEPMSLFAVLDDSPKKSVPNDAGAQAWIHGLLARPWSAHRDERADRADGADEGSSIESQEALSMVAQEQAVYGAHDRVWVA